MNRRLKRTLLLAPIAAIVTLGATRLYPELVVAYDSWGGMSVWSENAIQISGYASMVYGARYRELAGLVPDRCAGIAAAEAILTQDLRDALNGPLVVSIDEERKLSVVAAQGFRAKRWPFTFVSAGRCGFQAAVLAGDRIGYVQEGDLLEKLSRAPSGAMAEVVSAGDFFELDWRDCLRTWISAPPAPYFPPEHADLRDCDRFGCRRLTTLPEDWSPDYESVEVGPAASAVFRAAER